MRSYSLCHLTPILRGKTESPAATWLNRADETVVPPEQTASDLCRRTPLSTLPEQTPAQQEQTGEEALRRRGEAHPTRQAETKANRRGSTGTETRQASQTQPRTRAR
eukprot:7166639-Pyramimonas_sp.AAC.1